MRDRYPIVRHRELRPRWRWSAWLERRSPLVAGTGQILVHEIDGEYGTGTPAPERATAVTVVDVRKGVEVTAHWSVMARGSNLDFPVTVTYRCTVVDPVALIRSRTTGDPWDVRDVLALDPRPWELNRAHPEDDRDGLRQALSALLAPRPAITDIPGMRVELAGVEVERAQMLASDEA